MIFTGHVQRVRCVQWFDNDLGFATCCHGGNIYFYDLYRYTSETTQVGSRNVEKDFTKKDVQFTSLALVPNKPYEALACGSDMSISHTGDQPIPAHKTLDQTTQILVMPNGKSLITGSLSGTIQIYHRPENKPLDKVNSVLAHAKEVTKLKFCPTKEHLFSVGKDGMLCIFDLRDKDARQRELNSLKIPFSTEILTEEEETLRQMSLLDNLKQEANSLRENTQSKVE
jgi:WD40 repeat protein